MDNKTVITWGVWIVILFMIWIAYLVYRKLGGGGDIDFHEYYEE